MGAPLQNPMGASSSRIPEATDWNFLIIRKEFLTENKIKELKDDLIAIHKYEEDKQFPMYNEDETFLYLPRYYFKDRLKVINKIIDWTDKGNELKFKSNIKLWDYQIKAIEEFKAHLAVGKTGFFLGAAPGSGKTQMGIKMMEILGRTTLIVVPKKDLIHQWIDRILSTTNISREDIGICQNGKIEWKGKKVVVGLVHTLVKYKELKEFRKNFGVVVFDEVDSSAPPRTFAPAAVLFTAKYRICMTASKTRADGLHVIYQNHLVEVEINCEKSNTMQPTVLFINYNKSSGKLPYSKNRIRTKGMLLSLLAKNNDRNFLIAKYAHTTSALDKMPTAVLSDRISQLKAIEQYLVENHEVPRKKIGYYIGENNKEENKRVADNCDIILGTYGMLSRGTDIPRLSCLITATPRNDMRQIVGRIERVHPNKKKPLVIDIIDTSYALSIGGGEERLKFYQNKSLDIYEKSY